MRNVNHKGIPVRSSTYPSDWNPSSMQSYNVFMTHVVMSNIKNEGLFDDLPNFMIIDVRANEPIKIGEIIRSILSDQKIEMNHLVHNAKQIIEGGSNEAYD